MFGRYEKAEVCLKPISAQPNTIIAGGAERTPAVGWALGSLSLSMLMSSLDTSIANAGLPALAHAFNASFQDVQWIVLAYLLAVTTLIVSVGRLGDIIGRRRLLLAGVGLFTVASLVCGVAPTLGLLIAARAAQGLGAAIMMALTVAFVGDAMPDSPASAQSVEDDVIQAELHAALADALGELSAADLEHLGLLEPGGVGPATPAMRKRRQASIPLGDSDS